MSNSDSTDQHFPSYWRGYKVGTNRAEALARLKLDGDLLTGRVAMLDRIFGAVAVKVVGTLQDQRANLELREFRGFRTGTTEGVTLPVTGNLVVDINFDRGIAEGQWATDIGTRGVCRFQKTPNAWFRLYSTIAAAHLLRWIRIAYLSFLFATFLLDALGRLHLSYPGLILALVPAGYLFRFEAMELIRILGVKKLWGAEFQQPSTQNLPNPEVSSEPRPIQEAMRFVILDYFFAPRTKIMLLWLYAERAVDRAQFDAFARQIGVPQENIENTWNALFSTECATLSDGRIVITDLGKRYVEARLQTGTSVTASHAVGLQNPSAH
jgi:hypothetical protein